MTKSLSKPSFRLTFEENPERISMRLSLSTRERVTQSLSTLRDVVDTLDDTIYHMQLFPLFVTGKVTVFYLQSALFRLCVSFDSRH